MLQVAIVMAQQESEISALISEIRQLKREKANVERQLQVQKGVTPSEKDRHDVSNLVNDN